MNPAHSPYDHHKTAVRAIAHHSVSSKTAMVRWVILAFIVIAVTLVAVEMRVTLKSLEAQNSAIQQVMKTVLDSSSTFPAQVTDSVSGHDLEPGPKTEKISNSDESESAAEKHSSSSTPFEDPIIAWQKKVSAIRVAENKRNQAIHDRAKRGNRGEEPSEGDLKPSWLDSAEERRKKYPVYKEGLDLSKKYMFYKLCNDYAAGLLHYRRSLSGMLKEAHYLNRVLVWLPMVLPHHHNQGVIEIKDPALFFDKASLVKEYDVQTMDEAEFFGRYRRSILEGEYITWGAIGPAEDISPSDLKDRNDQVLQRDYSGRWNLFVFHLNDVDPLKDHNSPALYAPHLMALADEVIKELGEDYDAVHVRRGDKVKRVHQFPHLDNDTSPQALVEKLPKFVELGRTLYIATDEFKEGFFDPLKSLYNVKMADDFKHLWSIDSDWYKESLRIAGPEPPPTFDNFQRGYVDYTITEYAKKRVETFSDLATDPWNGV